MEMKNIAIDLLLT